MEEILHHLGWLKPLNYSGTKHWHWYQLVQQFLPPYHYGIEHPAPAIRIPVFWVPFGDENRQSGMALFGHGARFSIQEVCEHWLLKLCLVDAFVGTKVGDSHNTLW